MYRIEIDRPDLDETQILYAAPQWPFVLDADGFPVEDFEVIFEDTTGEGGFSDRLHVFHRLDSKEKENFGKMMHKVHLTKRNSDGWLIKNIKPAKLTEETDT